MNANYERFINRIKELRKEKNLTQDLLASKTSVQKQQILKYEKLQSEMPVPVAFEIAEALDTTLSDLVSLESSGIRAELHAWIERIPDEKLEMMSSLVIGQIRAIVFDENQASTRAK